MGDMGNFRKIYGRMQDEESRSIYMDRLNYSVTQDVRFLNDMIDKTVRAKPVWQEFCDLLREKQAAGKLILFGAGIWGNILYKETKGFVNWEYVVDSRPEGKKVGNLTVISFEKFIREYENGYIVISSYKNQAGMTEQLQKAGIHAENMINAGNVIYEITEKAIYFDLQALLPCKKREVFIDAGCFDGLTTRQFFDWCGGGGYSYCFEPDKKNISLINDTLSAYENYEIVNKALWSKTAVLAINEKGSPATSVAEGPDGSVQNIGGIALDDLLSEKEITFIKMDIEGSEAEALLGAGKIIAEQRPKLAVSIYHKFEDVLKIPQIILEYNENYKFYVRHYSFLDYDTVLYAIP